MDNWTRQRLELLLGWLSITVSKNPYHTHYHTQRKTSTSVWAISKNKIGTGSNGWEGVMGNVVRWMRMGKEFADFWAMIYSVIGGCSFLFLSDVGHYMDKVIHYGISMKAFFQSIFSTVFLFLFSQSNDAWYTKKRIYDHMNYVKQ